MGNCLSSPGADHEVAQKKRVPAGQPEAGGAQAIQNARITELQQQMAQQVEQQVARQVEQQVARQVAQLQTEMATPMTTQAEDIEKQVSQDLSTTGESSHPRSTHFAGRPKDSALLTQQGASTGASAMSSQGNAADGTESARQEEPGTRAALIASINEQQQQQMAQLKASHAAEMAAYKQAADTEKQEAQRAQAARDACITELQQQMTQQQAGHAAEMEARRQAAETEKQELQERFKHVEQERGNNSHEIMRMLEQLEKVEESKKEADGQVNDQRQHLGKLLQSSAREKTSLEQDLTASREESSRSKAELQASLQNLAREKASLEQDLTASREESSRSKAELQGSLQSLAHEKASLEQDLTASREESSRSKLELQASLQSLTREKASLEQDLAALQEDSSRSKAELQASLQSLAREKASLEQAQTVPPGLAIPPPTPGQNPPQATQATPTTGPSSSTPPPAGHQPDGRPRRLSWSNEGQLQHEVTPPAPISLSMDIEENVQEQPEGPPGMEGSANGRGETGDSNAEEEVEDHGAAQAHWQACLRDCFDGARRDGVEMLIRGGNFWQFRCLAARAKRDRTQCNAPAKLCHIQGQEPVLACDRPHHSTSVQPASMDSEDRYAQWQARLLQCVDAAAGAGIQMLTDKEQLTLRCLAKGRDSQQCSHSANAGNLQESVQACGNYHVVKKATQVGSHLHPR